MFLKVVPVLLQIILLLNYPRIGLSDTCNEKNLCSDIPPNPTEAFELEVVDCSRNQIELRLVKMANDYSEFFVKYTVNYSCITKFGQTEFEAVPVNHNGQLHSKKNSWNPRYEINANESYTCSFTACVRSNVPCWSFLQKSPQCIVEVAGSTIQVTTTATQHVPISSSALQHNSNFTSHTAVPAVTSNSEFLIPYSSHSASSVVSVAGSTIQVTTTTTSTQHVPVSNSTLQHNSNFNSHTAVPAVTSDSEFLIPYSSHISSVVSVVPSMSSVSSDQLVPFSNGSSSHLEPTTEAEPANLSDDGLVLTNMIVVIVLFVTGILIVVLVLFACFLIVLRRNIKANKRRLTYAVSDVPGPDSVNPHHGEVKSILIDESLQRIRFPKLDNTSGKLSGSVVTLCQSLDDYHPSTEDHYNTVRIITPPFNYISADSVLSTTSSLQNRTKALMKSEHNDEEAMAILGDSVQHQPCDKLTTEMGTGDEHFTAYIGSTEAGDDSLSYESLNSYCHSAYISTSTSQNEMQQASSIQVHYERSRNDPSCYTPDSIVEELHGDNSVIGNEKSGVIKQSHSYMSVGSIGSYYRSKHHNNYCKRHDTENKVHDYHVANGSSVQPLTDSCS